MEKENKAKQLVDEQNKKPSRKIKVKQETEEQSPIETPKVEELEILTCEQQKFYQEKLKDNPFRIEEFWTVLDELIVGEENNKKILFYNMLSAKLPTPNGTIIVGSASSGKTHMVRETIKLLPDGMKMPIGGMSKKGLIHMKGNLNPVTFEKTIDLTGKVLWFLEESGGEESYAYLRPILSRDQEEIRFEIPTKKRSKKGSEFFSNEIIIIKGCPAYVTTSTKEKRLAETGTRVFLLSPDESREQNNRIVKAKINGKRFMKEKIDLEPFKQFIRELKSYDVWIPFADIIDINTLNLNVRRDIDKIFSLINTHVLINQEERYKISIKGKEYLIANLDDYFYILKILLPVIKPTLLNLPKKVLDFYDKLFTFDTDELTHKNISLALKMNQNTVRTYCWELVQAGYLVFEKEKRENVYQVIDNTSQSLPFVTIAGVTQNMIDRSRKEIKQWLNGSVTNSQVLINDINTDIDELLLHIYLVTDNTFLKNEDISLMAEQNSVTDEKVTLATLEEVKCVYKPNGEGSSGNEGVK